MKIETGVMVMKDGKAWGVTYADGQSTSYGWIEPENAPIHDARFVKKSTDVTWRDSYLTKELSTGTLVNVRRTTTVEIVP